ncbi:MAG: hypothetical protein SH868_09970 [Bythopirellula sp.]|nr:hypothetical protein [Bythopirellula sp.]
MALVLQIVLGILLLMGLVSIFLATKHWHWSWVTIVAFILLSTIGYLFLAAETMRIHRNLRMNLARLEQNVATLEQQNETLLRGANDAPGILQLKHELQMVTLERGRAWRQVAPAGAPDKDGRFAVTIESPTPHGLEVDTIVYAFEAGGSNPNAPADGKQYLGDFRVVEATDKGAVLEAVNLLDQRTGERIANSEAPWNLYETMPVDRYKTFAELSEEDVRKLLPEAIVEEYLRHGQEATADDDPRNVVGYDENDQRLAPEDLAKAVKKVYNRPLRDYAFLFSELARQKVVLMARVDAVREDNAKLEVAIASAEKLTTFREEETKLMTSDLTSMKKDRQAIEKHLQMVKRQLDNASELIDKLLATNSNLAEELTQREASLKQMIDAVAPAPATSVSLP